MEGIIAVAQANTSVEPPSWNVTGHYTIDLTVVENEATIGHWTEYLILEQGDAGAITGTSLALAGPASIWTIDTGSVIGNILTFEAYYQTNPSMRIFCSAEIQSDGSMIGDWHDLAPGTRAGEWTTTVGTSVFLLPESPLGSAAIILSTFSALGAFAGITRYRKKNPLTKTTHN